MNNTKLNEKFLAACYAGNIDVISACVRENVNMDCADAYGNTGLHQAAIQNNANIVDLLLEEGSTTDWINKKGETALLMAAKMYHVNAGLMLLQWGAVASEADHQGNTALHYVAKKLESGSPPAPAYEYTLKRSAFGSRKEEKDYKKFARVYVKALKDAKRIQDEQYKAMVEDQEEEEEGESSSQEEQKTEVGEKSKSGEEDEEEGEYEMGMTDEQLERFVKTQMAGFDIEENTIILQKVGLYPQTYDCFEKNKFPIKTYVHLRSNDFFDQDTDRKIEIIFQLCLDKIGCGDIQDTFLFPPENINITLEDGTAQLITKKELQHPALLDAEDFDDLRLYLALRYCDLKAYYSKLKEIKFSEATVVQLRAFGFDLSDNLRFIMFCKLCHIKLENFFPVPLKKDMVKVDNFVRKNDELALASNELIRLAAFLSLQSMKLDQYFHRIDKTCWIDPPKETPNMTSFDLDRLGFKGKTERIRVLIALKVVGLDKYFTQFISKGYVKMEFFRMANEQDLMDIGLNREERKVYILHHLMCPFTLRLCQVNASLNAVDTGGYTPLHWAARSNNAAAARVLLERGAEKNPVDKLGRTPLHIASLANSPNVVRVLLLRKAKKNPRDNNGNTPIHTGAKFNSVDAVLELCKKGCNPNLTNCVGENADACARRLRNFLVCEAILKYASAIYDSD
jgi:ankyrin repeat protein